MKKFFFILFVLLVSFYFRGFSQEKDGRNVIVHDSVSTDSTEYELLIIDPGFETWLVTRPSKEFYSQSYYENMNRLYVTEWNYRYFSNKGHGEYDSYIDYDPKINYGLDLNYELYYYFKYFEEKHGTRFYPAFK